MLYKIKLWGNRETFLDVLLWFKWVTSRRVNGEKRRWFTEVQETMKKKYTPLVCTLKIADLF